MTAHLYRKIQHAIKDASDYGPMIVAWEPQRLGWVVYSPGNGPQGVEADLLCPGGPDRPVALSWGGKMLLETVYPQEPARSVNYAHQDHSRSEVRSGSGTFRLAGSVPGVFHHVGRRAHELPGGEG